jgi:hypothetical protein
MTQYYASKELIDQAVQLTGRTINNNNDHYLYLGACSLLVKDLAKAELLSDETCPSNALLEATQKAESVEHDDIDRQWLRAIFALIERHGLDPALEIHTTTNHVLQERGK